MISRGGVRRRYQIGYLVLFEIYNNMRGLRRLLASVEDRYRDFGVPDTTGGAPDLVVEIGPFEPDIQDCEVLEERVFIKPDYLYVARESHKLGGWWSFDASGLEGGLCVVRVDANMQALPMISGTVIDFFIHYALLNKATPILHASAVARDGRGFLFSGLGGSGKTTIMMESVLNNGWLYLSDNYVVCSAGEALNYPSALNIVDYNLRREVWNAMSIRDRLALAFWSGVYRITGGHIKIFRRVSARSVFLHNVVDRARIAAVCLLLPSGELAVREAPRKDSIARLVSSLKLEFLRFFRYAELQASALGDTRFARWWMLSHRLIDAALPQDVRFYEVEVPATIRPEDVRELLELISRGGGKDAS